METSYLSQPHQLPRQVADAHIPGLSYTQEHPHHVTTTEYIIEALGEGIKQNFLGYNIDMEFLTLTARSVVLSSANVIKQYIVKPIAAKLHRGNGHHSYTQTSF